MVKDIYKTMGFRETEPSKYELKVSEYTVKETFIKEQ